MSCELCRGALNAAPNATVDTVNAVNAKLGEPCACEQFSMSELSPGLVDDGEYLHYLVPTPEGRLADGHLNPINLVQVDRGGLSVLRQGAKNTEFEQTVQELRPRWQTNKKALEGVMTFPVSVVRYREEQRLCCVYDTALPGKPHHADLMMPALGGELSRTQRDRLQKARIKALVDQIGTNFEPIEQFRAGSLAHLGAAN